MSSPVASIVSNYIQARESLIKKSVRVCRGTTVGKNPPTPVSQQVKDIACRLHKRLENEFSAIVERPKVLKQVRQEIAEVIGGKALEGHDHINPENNTANHSDQNKQDSFPYAVFNNGDLTPDEALDFAYENIDRFDL
jgi:hypothetical protein